jgi:hypothetical protein
VHDAIANAVTKINKPELSYVYSAKYEKSVPNTLMSQSRRSLMFTQLLGMGVQPARKLRRLEHSRHLHSPGLVSRARSVLVGKAAIWAVPWQLR